MSEVFLDDLVSPYYEDLGLKYRNNLAPGQICWVAILYTYEHAELWRPQNTDQTGTVAKSFGITPAGEDAYKRSAPLADPKLTTREEFPVVRAKIRPVILLTSLITEIQSQSGKGENRINSHRCLVTPLYSIIDSVTEVRKYPKDFVDRVRTLEYPQFSYAPKNANARIHDSIVRLDAIQAVYHNRLEPSGLRSGFPT